MTGIGHDRPRHLVLVGLPGAGKSTVGALVAARLGRAFLDFDTELERRVGLSVAEQFARFGEPAFRAAEADLSREIADAAAMVLAPGGGWMTNQAATATLRPVGRIIYLRVTPECALARLGPATAGRPLLAGARPLDALRAVLARRGAAYETADAVLDAAAPPHAVADAVLALAVGRFEVAAAAVGGAAAHMTGRTEDGVR